MYQREYAGLSGLDASTKEIMRAPERPPVDMAIEQLEKEVACLREEVNMLLCRLHCVTKPIPIRDTDGVNSAGSCSLESAIRSAAYGISEISALALSARNALCI